jgi:3',5'-cyclic AMP phosphodiesterase CpdA
LKIPILNIVKMKITKSQLFLTIILFTVTTTSFTQIDDRSLIPHRITLNITEEPATSIAVTWRTMKIIKQPQVRIAKSTGWIDFENKLSSISTKTEEVILLDSTKVYHYSSVVKDLLPNTLYIYCVGGDSVWSEWNHFRTAKEDNTRLTFTYFGDMQHDIKKFGSRVFRKALTLSPNSNFWLFSGDLLDRAEYDYQWDEFFQASGFITSVMPCVLAAGNHEYADTVVNGVEVETFVELWRHHITQPTSEIDGLSETVFSFIYQGVRFIVLNGNEKLEEQSEWLEKVLAKNKSLWTIVTIHQPIYSMGKNRDQRKTKNAFLHLFDKYNVDLVLQGHDHVYARTFKLKNDKIVSDNERGTVYITSNSGSDDYNIQSINSHFAIKHSTKAQLFQIISIDNNKLQMNTYTATGDLYDNFELTK